MINGGTLISFMLGNLFFLMSLLTYNMNEKEMQEIHFTNFDKLYYSTYFALIAFILIIKI